MITVSTWVQAEIYSVRQRQTFIKALLFIGFNAPASLAVEAHTKLIRLSIRANALDAFKSQYIVIF
tara:strand:- start:74 stop:271 length:198 start_codon:yes stop_codon:yes gene_type:complete